MKTNELTDEQVDHYRREGYVVLPSFFGPDALARITQRIQQIGDDALASGDHDHILEVEPETVALHAERGCRRVNLQTPGKGESGIGGNQRKRIVMKMREVGSPDPTCPNNALHSGLVGS